MSYIFGDVYIWDNVDMYYNMFLQHLTDFGLLIGSDILNFHQRLGAVDPRVLDRLVPQLEPPFGNPVYGPVPYGISVFCKI